MTAIDIPFPFGSPTNCDRIVKFRQPPSAKSHSSPTEWLTRLVGHVGVVFATTLLANGVYQILIPIWTKFIPGRGLRGLRQ